MTMSPTKPNRKALFAEGGPVPAGGVCLSSFVVLRSGPKILVGKMARPEIWVDRFFVGEQYAPNYASSGKLLIPGSHLAWYESPEDAARRVLKEQVMLPLAERNAVRLKEVQSHMGGDPSSETEPPHWDICFVYETNVLAKSARKLASPEWFEGFGFVPAAKLKADDFTRGHGDVLEQAGVIGLSKKRKSTRRRRALTKPKRRK